jgi:soluble lytic murein transglycosylase-like protein
LFETCPVSSNIRVSDPKAAERFSALDACDGKMVAAPRDDLPPDRNVVRIIGVKAKSGARPEREDEEQPRARRTNASFERGSTAGSDYDRHIRRTAAAHRIDPLFLHALIRTESGYRAGATSPQGALGLMQIMPATGTTLGVDRGGLLDPGTNIEAGARLLKRLQRRYGRNFDLILSAYNAGEGAVARYGNRIPPYRETQDYVVRVMGRYQALRSGFGRAQ